MQQDLGGQTSIRPYWRCYYANTAAVIFVVDSTDIERLQTAADELAAMLNEEELKDAALLVFANKQDQPGAKGAGDISQALRLGELRDRNWSIMACSAVDGSGVTEGMDWLVVSSTSPWLQNTCADQNSKPSLKTRRRARTSAQGPALIGSTCSVASQWAVQRAVHTNRQTIWQSLTLATAFIGRARVHCRLEQHVHTKLMR